MLSLFVADRIANGLITLVGVMIGYIMSAVTVGKGEAWYRFGVFDIDNRDQRMRKYWPLWLGISLLLAYLATLVWLHETSKSRPNQALQHNAYVRHASCLRTSRVDDSRG